MTREELEKEAKEYRKDLKSKFFLSEPQLDLACQGFKDGYNKANEWHKDLPKEDVNLAIIEVEDCGYLLCEYRKGIWYDNGSSSVCKDWITRNIKGGKKLYFQRRVNER